MSRKDYILIAKAIYAAKVKAYSNELYNSEAQKIIYTTLEYVVVNLCNEMKYDNAAFDRTKFYNAALTDKTE